MKFQLYAAIDEWSTGTHENLYFTANVYVDVYNGHIGTLNNLRAERPAAFHVIMADLYTLARCLSQIIIMIIADQLLQFPDRWRLVTGGRGSDSSC